MAQYVFKGGYPRYYPTIPLFAKPGEIHEIASAPDAEWQLLDAEAAAVAPPAVHVSDGTAVVLPVAENPAPAVESVTSDVLTAAEALLEANPELARKLVEDVKNA